LTGLYPADATNAIPHYRYRHTSTAHLCPAISCLRVTGMPPPDLPLPASTFAKHRARGAPGRAWREDLYRWRGAAACGQWAVPSFSPPLSDGGVRMAIPGLAPLALPWDAMPSSRLSTSGAPYASLDHPGPPTDKCSADAQVYRMDGGGRLARSPPLSWNARVTRNDSAAAPGWAASAGERRTQAVGTGHTFR